MFFNLIYKLASGILYLALHISSNGVFPPPLSAAEEQELLTRMQNGDNAAKDKLIEHNLRLVAHIVKKYYTAENPEDLISIGTIGLIKAVSTFKSNKGIRLATYASRCIDNEILMYFRALKKTSQDIYISDPIDTDKDGNTLTLIDIISDNSDIADDIAVKLQLEKLKTVINDALDSREKTIICYRYGIGGFKELTQSEIAKKLNISRSYVSRIEKSALEKLRILIE